MRDHGALNWDNSRNDREAKGRELLRGLTSVRLDQWYVNVTKIGTSDISTTYLGTLSKKNPYKLSLN